MSELEVRRARMEVEKSAAEFEQALDQLREQVESGVEAARDLGSRMKQPSELFDEFIDNTISYAKNSAEKLFRDLRGSAEEELRKLDQRPMGVWATVLGAGLVAGFLLARGQKSEPRNGERQNREVAF